jgi:hypothetical protein
MGYGILSFFAFESAGEKLSERSSGAYIVRRKAHANLLIEEK